MDETLKHLLEVELEAERITREADQQREQTVQHALEQARAEELRFEARVPELHASFIDKAGQRAEQAIAELKRRYDEQHTRLRELAAANEQQAIDTALALFRSSAEPPPGKPERS